MRCCPSEGDRFIGSSFAAGSRGWRAGDGGWENSMIGTRSVILGMADVEAARR